MTKYKPKKPSQCSFAFSNMNKEVQNTVNT